MSWPSRPELRQAQSKLRQYDNALRLRFSQEETNTVLIERKTFRGRYWTMAPGGIPWSPNTGRRKEEGHVHVGAIQSACFNLDDLLDSLKYADTWQRSKPLWQRVEEQEAQQLATRRRNREFGLRYKSSELFDRYVWKYKQRISVPTRIA